MRKILLLGIFLLSLIFFGSTLLSSGETFAQVAPLNSFCNEAQKNVDYNSETNTVCDSNKVDATGKNDPFGKNGIFKKVIDIMSFLSGFLAVIFIMVGAFSIITSGGESEKVKNGRSKIIYALVGILVIISSNLIINFVISIVNS